MKTVLIADTDPAALKTLSRVLKSYSDIFRITTAGSGDDVIRHLKTGQVDMVVVDVSISANSNHTLSDYLNDNFPDIPLIVTADPGSKTIEASVKHLDISDYFEKPVDIQAFCEKILSGLNELIHGEIHGIGLPYFLQMLELEEKTCALTISVDDCIGQINILNGELISAETDTLKNEDAVYEILSWDNPSIIFENYIKKGERTIETPLASLVLNGLRQKDEADLQHKKPRTKKSSKKSDQKKAKPRDSGIEFIIGSYFHLRVEDVSFTYRSPLLGMKSDQFLILGMPDNFEGKVTLFKGKDIIVKYIFEGAICAFKTKLIGFVHTPCELLFLKYPNLVGYHNIRLHHRVKCFIPARIVVEGLTKLGVIVDISKKGCGCQIHTLSSDEWLSFEEGKSISLMSRFPGVEGEVHILGVLQNIRHSSEGTILGVKFHETISETIQETISQFVVSIGDLQLP